MRQIVLDTETTGLSPKEGHRVIEIGAIEMIDRRLTDNHFHEYINPERKIDQGAINVHGITNEFLQDKPLFKDLIEGFISYIEGAELIIHNAPFDVGFLDAEFKGASPKYKKIKNYCGVVDTLKMARKKHPGQRNSLDALCKRYDVNNEDRVLHGALLDSKLLAQVYLLMTGGQVNMFGDEKLSPMSENADQMEHKIQRNQALKVIKASVEELAAHDVFLEMMRE